MSISMGLRRVLSGAAVVVTLALPSLVATQEAGAASNTAQITDVRGVPIQRAGSGTQFGILLPPAAACPGDTEHDDYLVSSFVSPAGVAPEQVAYKLNYPTPGVDLVTTNGVPYIDQATQPFTAQLSTPPLFSWSRYAHDTADLPMGRYTVGIACIKPGADSHPLRYWTAQVEFTASSSDPGGFVWQVVGAPKSSSSSAGVVVLVVVAGVAVIGAALVALRRRGKPSGRMRGDVHPVSSQS